MFQRICNKNNIAGGQIRETAVDIVNYVHRSGGRGGQEWSVLGCEENTKRCYTNVFCKMQGVAMDINITDFNDFLLESYQRNENLFSQIEN